MPYSSVGSLKTSSLSIITDSFITTFTPGNNSVFSPSIVVILNSFLASKEIVTVSFSIV